MKKGDHFNFEFQVTGKIYKNFIESFQDKNPLHTDKQFAQSKGFASEVMHGNILGGFISYFIGECLPDKNVIIHSQEIKYIKPVYLNNKLFFTAEIEDVYESVKTIVFKFTFENEQKQKIAKGNIQIGII